MIQVRLIYLLKAFLSFFITPTASLETHLTKTVYKYGNLDGRNIVLPPTFFYPISKQKGDFMTLRGKVLNILGYDIKPLFNDVRYYSFAS